MVVPRAGVFLEGDAVSAEERRAVLLGWALWRGKDSAAGS